MGARMTETVTVSFNIKDGTSEAFQTLLRIVSDSVDNSVLGYRTISANKIDHRPVLASFADAMEAVLRRHDAKKTWRERPIPALVRLLELEIEEFRVAFDYFEVGEARKECVDIANFALFVWDRLGMLNPNTNVKEQIDEK